MKRSLESRMRYNKEHTIQYGFRLNKRTDEDIIKMLESRTSKMGYVKSLIRRDIKRREERRAKGIRGLEVMLGPNTNQYWVYDDIDDVFIDPPKELVQNRSLRF